jgi:hypothetical protein
VEFFNTSTAANGGFTANGGSVDGGIGGTVFFHDASTAASANVVANGSGIGGAIGGNIVFFGNSTAAGSTLTVTGGTNGGTGGSLFFFGSSTGGTARVIVNGDGDLNIDLHAAPGVTIGSLEGNGNVFLGGNNLTVGSNNMSTLFSGVIQELGPSDQGPAGGSVCRPARCA